MDILQKNAGIVPCVIGEITLQILSNDTWRIREQAYDSGEKESLTETQVEHKQTMEVGKPGGLPEKLERVDGISYGGTKKNSELTILKSVEDEQSFFMDKDNTDVEEDIEPIEEDIQEDAVEEINSTHEPESKTETKCNNASTDTQGSEKEHNGKTKDTPEKGLRGREVKARDTRKTPVKRRVGRTSTPANNSETTTKYSIMLSNGEIDLFNINSALGRTLSVIKASLMEIKEAQELDKNVLTSGELGTLANKYFAEALKTVARFYVTTPDSLRSTIHQMLKGQDITSGKLQGLIVSFAFNGAGIVGAGGYKISKLEDLLTRVIQSKQPEGYSKDLQAIRAFFNDPYSCKLMMGGKELKKVS